MKWSHLLLTGATKTKFPEVDHTLQTHWCHLYSMVCVLWKMRRHLQSQNHFFHHSACWLVHFLSDQREAPTSQGLLMRVFLNHQLSVQIHTHGLKKHRWSTLANFLNAISTRDIIVHLNQDWHIYLVMNQEVFHVSVRLCVRVLDHQLTPAMSHLRTEGPEKSLWG